MVKKSDFLQVVKIPYPKENDFWSIWGHFSQRIKFFMGGWFFLVSTFKGAYFNEKMSSWAGLKNVFLFPAKVLILAIFDYLGPPSKPIFSTYRQNFGEYSVSFLGEVVRNIVLNFELSIFKKVPGVAVLHVDIFQKPWF